jgi:hypothetical protein
MLNPVVATGSIPFFNLNENLSIIFYENNFLGVNSGKGMRWELSLKKSELVIF